MRRSHVTALFRFVLLGAAALLCACGSDPNTEVIEYCIPLESEGNVPVARVLMGYRSYAADERPAMADTQRFLISTETPITVVDHEARQGWQPGDATDVALVTISLAVLDATAPEVVGRAAFWDVSAMALTLPEIGPANTADRYDGILGGDLLRKYTVRLVYTADPLCKLPWFPADLEPTWPSISFFNEWPDSDGDLSRDGYGVIDYHLSGGGTALVADHEHEIAASRMAVSACVEADPYDPSALPCPDEFDSAVELVALIPESGVDAYGLIATGTQPLVFSESFYQRLAAAKAGQGWPVSGVSSTTLGLPEGGVPAQSFELVRMALVGDQSDARAPCRELAHRRRLDWMLGCGFSSEAPGALGRRAASVLEVDTARPVGSASARLPTYVVSDTTALMTGLQSEISTAIPSVDLLVGAAFLAHYELILDYPESRLIMRCMEFTSPQERCKEVDPETNTCADSEVESFCPFDFELIEDGKSCCRYNRACQCAGSPCCQYYRWSTSD